MKRILTLALTVLFCLTAVAPGFAAALDPQTAQNKMVTMEKFLYGTEQSGALIARVDSIEIDVYGRKTTNPVLTRVDNIYDYLFGVPGDGSLSFASKLNAAEWQLMQEMSDAPAKTRLEKIEDMLYGSLETNNALAERLENLLQVAFPEASLVGTEVNLPKDTLVKVAFLQELRSKENRVGDAVRFKVEENVYVDNVLALPKGAIGTGNIQKIVPARSFGRDARIDIAFTDITAIDGTKVPVFVGDLAKQEAKTAAGAAGASIGGMIVLGPIGAIGGAFVTGKSMVIPVGSTTFVQVSDDTHIFGLIQGEATEQDSDLPETYEEQTYEEQTVVIQ
ncbi:MAG TPA: hypothetical protein IAB06_01660 [Candidatus Avacidaminococcus intestinavium]|uniref:Uncharacterized protein n=1 Tax=Candidatus Avacidaminococcus intestinavium TaxID=2840684 RepID=A0A9D1MPG0_9FIRM|nr:hypothetical protein [Candidatus Avacidaminococcus intestinavium]